MSSISARLRFLISFVRIPPEMWDFIVPQGPVLRSAASKEYVMAGIVRDIAKQVHNRELSEQIRSAGSEMVQFAANNLVNGWEEGDDLCPLIPHHFPIPHYGPQPEPWIDVNIAALNPQPLPPAQLSSALKVLASLTSLKNVAEQLREISNSICDRQHTVDYQYN